MNQIKLTPKDFFLHLGATIALYASVIAFINLSFSIINYFAPDKLAGSFSAIAVAWPISVLVIIVPTLYLLEWLIKRDITLTPEKGELWIRKWRIYLTLFLTVILIGGDLITLINTYLSGEITARFVYKVLAVLVVGGLVGKYYFYSLYSNFGMSKIITKIEPVIGAVLVVAVVVTGFIVVGSPSERRNLRFDAQRVNDLSNVQYQVVEYWRQKDKLPVTLEDLNDTLYGYTVPKDPDTEAAYEYSIKGENKFELCATFALPTSDDKGRGEYNYGGGYMVDMAYPSYGGVDDNWKHEAGRACFERTIDPDKYPKLDKVIY